MADENEEPLDGDLNEDDFEGTPVFPPGTSERHRRRLLQAIAGGGTVALAGCIGWLAGVTVVVETRAPADIGESTATLVGEVTELENADQVTVAFEYGEAGTDLEQTVGAGSLDAPGEFEEVVEGLNPDTEYEFRAIAEAEGERGIGDVVDFTTMTEPFFAVDFDVPDQLGIDEETEIVGTVENVGGVAGVQEVTLGVEGERIEQEVSESVSDQFALDPDESAALSLDVVTGGPGDTYELEIESGDDARSETRRVGPPDYSELDFMVPDVAPKELVKDINVQVAFNDEEIIFRYWWDQPDPGGWIHDMIVYDGDEGEWKRYADWDPWVLDDEHGFPERHNGFYEDRLSWMWHDGTLEGFENFGGWLTVMEGVRTLPGYPGGDAIDDHPYFGVDNRDEGDMRKYIPQSREGEWWEHDWDAPKDPDELDRMLEDGEFIDLPMWRAHRSNAMGHGTNHYILAYREGNETGDRTFVSQGWDPEDGPEYMFDPDIVNGGAIDINDVLDEDGNPLDTMPDQEDFEEYALMLEGERENAVEFDPDVAEWDGAMIPRRPLIEPSESGASWKAEGSWENGQWEVIMRRELDTGYVDDMPLEESETYTFSPAIHHGVSQRWHWVSYPLKLGLGEDAEFDWFGEDTLRGTSQIVAERVEDEPEWDTIEAYTIPLVYPGQTDWTWLTSGQHPRQDDVRNAEITIWEHHDEFPEDFVERMLALEKRFASRK